MKLFNILLIPYDSANDFHLKLKKKITLHFLLELAKLFFIISIAGFFLLEYAAPFARNSLGIEFPDKIGRFVSFTGTAQETSAREVLQLAHMIRMITDDKLSERKALRYAGLISQASQKFRLNPLEIIALIMAESSFKENAINNETGDYGLGQINWGHWGKDYGYTPQQLLDPAINIFLTCHVYKFFGEDFGKYHRGSGIQCTAYLVNVKSILSTLNAFEASKKRNVS